MTDTGDVALAFLHNICRDEAYGSSSLLLLMPARRARVGAS